MKIRYYIVFIMLVFLQKAGAQDYHLSQYDAAFQYLNPGMTGMGFGKNQGDYRINADFRSQWRSLTNKPFTTAFLSYDMHFKNKWGIGGYLINNRAGAGKMNTFNFMVSGAYNVAVDHHHHHYFSGGLQLGIFQRSLGYSEFFLNDQYSASYGGFDPGISSNENFASGNILRPDGNVGVYYSYKNRRKQLNPFGGFAIHHVLRPNESFDSEEKYRLPLRYVLHGGLHYNMSDIITLTPNLLFMYQGKAHEINMGLMLNYTLGDSPNDVILGMAFRTSDAMIIHLGFKQGLNTFRFSYDINTSPLTYHTRGKGGFEFSAIYTGTKKRKGKGHGHPHLTK